MLRVSDLSVARGGRRILSDLSFEVSAGEALILRGANGVGKTSLLRTLAGLQSPVSGQVEYAEDTAAYASHADGVKATLSVTENLAFWAQTYGGTLGPSVFKRFDLEDLRDRAAGTLSAGQKRRVGLARLAVLNRPLWLLDEPTVSLDRFSVKLFEDMLTANHLAKGGAAVIATHIDLNIPARTLDLDAFATDTPLDADTDEAFL